MKHELLDYINKVEAYDFEGEAGPLTLCNDWISLKVWVLKILEDRIAHPYGTFSREFETR